MANDHSLAIRRAIVAALRADDNITGLVPAFRVYGEETPPEPVQPFIRVEFPISSAYESSCGAGSDASVVVHGFAEGPGADRAASIGAAIATALDDAALDLGSATLVACDYQDSSVIRDTGEASAYHAIVRFNIQTVEG